MSVAHQYEQETVLAWERLDIEQRLFFRGGRFTQVNTVLSGLLALIATIAIYVTLLMFPQSIIAAKLVGQGAIPYAIVYLSMWCLAILMLKWRKLCLQRRLLEYRVTPETPDFILSAASVDEVIDLLFQLVDDPKHFLLFNRIAIALANLRNIGRVSDVDEILRSQAEHDESAMETSYVLIGGFIWAIPILGFIGTVLGLSVAIGEFSGIISASDPGQSDQLQSGLQQVMGGLGTAFDTTLEALVGALVIQTLTTFLRKSEQQFMDSCSEYCVRNIVNKLRIMPYQQDADD